MGGLGYLSGHVVVIGVDGGGGAEAQLGEQRMGEQDKPEGSGHVYCLTSAKFLNSCFVWGARGEIKRPIKFYFNFSFIFPD